MQRVDSPNPAANGFFSLHAGGAGDLDGDGKFDFLSGQSAGSPNGDGQVFVMSGRTGGRIDTIFAPDTGGAGSAIFGFPWASRVGFNGDPSSDLGSCPGGSTGVLCPSSVIGPPDGVPDILVGARGVDPRGVRDAGRAYVFDGATRALLKRIDQPVEDATPLAVSRPGGNWFGRVVLWPSGQPACEGHFGVGPCASLSPANRIGDMDGEGRADIVISASQQTEDSTTAHPNSHCASTAGANCRSSGRIYIYRGEDIVGSNPAEILDGVGPGETIRKIRNPHAQADTIAGAESESFGNFMIPIGDVGSCTPAPPAPTEEKLCPPASRSTTPDGKPEVVVGASGIDLPLNSPDPTSIDVGAAVLIDGATGTVLHTYHHPEPQAGSRFGTPDHHEPASGDLGESALPDVVLPAPSQHTSAHTGGRAYVMNGNYTAGSGNISFGILNDPTPGVGENFGSGSAGVGDLVAGAQNPRNEVLIGGGGPLVGALNQDTINDVHFFNPANQRVLQTIPDPDQQGGSGFGEAIVPLGDLNGDGFLDLMVGAWLYDGDAGSNQGRAYIFRSNNTPPPTPAGAETAAATPQPPTAPAPPAAAAGLSTAKLALARATINRRDSMLDVLAPITSLASGSVRVELHAAGRRHRFTAPINSRDGRIRFRQRIPKEQADVGTGILTITYPGDADTRPQTVRLRAASQRADLRLSRPTITGGRLRASGTVSDRARGVARVQIEYVAGGETTTLQFNARINNGKWSLNQALSQTVRDAIARRTGTVHSYTLFTGYLPARMRGEMRSFQVLAER